MTRKQFKTIQNIAAVQLGREQAKQVFNKRDGTQFMRLSGAYLHKPTATLFVL